MEAKQKMLNVWKGQYLINVSFLLASVTEFKTIMLSSRRHVMNWRVISLQKMFAPFFEQQALPVLVPKVYFSYDAIPHLCPGGQIAAKSASSLFISLILLSGMPKG
jgi:hypothetical protein